MSETADVALQAETRDAIASTFDNITIHDDGIQRPDSVSEEPAVIRDEAQAVTKKDEGNGFFRQGDWESAIRLYTEAIELAETDQTKAQSYGNRAACYIEMVS